MNLLNKKYSAVLIAIGALSLTMSCTNESSTQNPNTPLKSSEESPNSTNNESAETPNADFEMTMASPRDFKDSKSNTEFKSLVFPKASCDTNKAATRLNQYVRLQPTFDGVSPWPGLFGFWIHQKAGIYAVVSPQHGFETNAENGKKIKIIKIKVKLVDLCSNKAIAQGEKIVRATAKTMAKIQIPLNNHTLKDIVSPVIIINRIADPTSQEPMSDLVGMTIKYRLKGTDKNQSLQEAILLRNVLNL